MPDISKPAKRRSKRITTRIAVTLVLEGNEAQQLSSAIELSQYGLRLQTDLTLEPGQRVGLLLGNARDYVIGARVVWLGKMDSAQSGHVGLEFLHPLDGTV
jgi:hypothetical protein